ENLRPMKRLIEKTVFSGLVIAWRRATCPIKRSPVLGLTATTDGVSRDPSEFSRTIGSPASMMAATELVVPRSMPSTFATRVLHVARMGRPSAGPQDLQRLIQEADCFAPVGSTVAPVVELAAELLKPVGELQRELDPSQVHAQVLGQVLDLA